MVGDREQPRRPKDMKGLLKFCLEATRGEDAPDISDPEAVLTSMGEERRQWLEEALQSMSVDVIQQLGNGIKTLIDPSADLDDKEEVLDCLEDWLGNIDMAVNFHKIGGFQALQTCLDSPHPSLRSGACHLSAEISQNNPYVQDKLLQDGFLEGFLGQVDSDPDSHCQVKALYAVSCLVRECLPAVARMDWDIVTRALIKEEPKLRTKACFLISAVAEDNLEVAEALVSRGLLLQFLHMLEAKSPQVDPELVLRALNSLLLSVKGREEAGRLGIVSLVGERLGEMRGKDEHEEAVQLSHTILRKFVDPGSEHLTFRAGPGWGQAEGSRFIPEGEWKEVKEGQALPPGCLVQMDLASGIKRAKIDPDYELPACLR